MKQPARKFLAPNGRTVSQPLREHLPLVADDKDTVDLIKGATRLIDEPECPSRAIVDAQAELARTYDRLRYAADVEQAQQARRLLSIEARMADVQRRAKLRHADVSHEMHLMRRNLERARSGGRQEPQEVVQRLERIEARLDYRPDLEDAA